MSTIHWLPSTSIFHNDSSGNLILGSPGAGKSFFLLNTMANCLGMRQRVIGIDPKNDLMKLKNISNEIEIIDINKIRDGALNPFTFLDRIDATTLLTIIEMICGKLERSDIISITPIIKDFVTEYKRDNEYKDMQDVADYLFGNQNESAQMIGSVLRLNEDSKYGRLLFTRETHVEPLYLPRDKSFIISIQGMSLPSYSTKIEDYTAEQRFTSAIVFIIIKKLEEILSGKNKIPVNLVLDEAHVLFGNPEMSRVIHNFLALGRSLNISTILASQGMSHFPDTIPQFISSKFMFRSAMNEVEAFLDVYDTSKLDMTKSLDKENVMNGIINLNPGECFYIDRSARHGFCKIISNYPVELLTSNPIDRKDYDES